MEEQQKGRGKERSARRSLLTCAQLLTNIQPALRSGEPSRKTEDSGCRHTHTHSYTLIHTCMHTDTHMHAHSYTHTHPYTYRYTHTHTHSRNERENYKIPL